jgi:FHS family Na+ dependent glucose MFS transporter 1
MIHQTHDPIRPSSDGKIAKTTAYYAAFTALGLAAASLGPTLPGLAEHTHSHLNEISFLFTARSSGYLLGSLSGGRWYDRLPGHRVQAFAMLVMAGMLGLIPGLPILWLLALALLVLGFAEATLDVGGNTLLVWLHREKVGPFMNGLHLFFGLGAFLSPVIIAQAVLLSGDINWAYWTLALLLLPVVAWLAFLPSPKIPDGVRDEQPGGTRNGLVLLFMLFFFLYVGAENSFAGWVFTYAQALKIGTAVTAAYLTSAFWGAFTIGRLAAIPLAARFHSHWILLCDLAGCLLSLGIVLFGRSSAAAVWLGSAGTGLFMASIFPTAITLAGRYLRINGSITGWFFVGASGGGMFLPWLIGQLFEPVGPQVSMIVILLALVLALVEFSVLVFWLGQSALQPDTA